MITGANTNVRYRGILFHVQTEDSGRANPHIISHLYHGGTILGSQKTDYSEKVESDDLISVVRGMIDEQHAAMVEKLNGGGFDEVIVERLGTLATDAGFSAPAASPAPRSPDAPDSGEHTRPEQVAAGSPGSARPDAESALRDLLSERDEGKKTRAFGEGLGSSKPLDEAILDYLAEKARSRADSPPPKTPADG